MNTLLTSLPVAVIGAGPVDLAAAAHLHAAGFTPLVLEAGATIASNLESYRHVRMFSPWRYNNDHTGRGTAASGVLVAGRRVRSEQLRFLGPFGAFDSASAANGACGGSGGGLRGADRTNASGRTNWRDGIC